MRYRALSPTGDYTFGAGVKNYLINTPQAVGQAVQTRLLLMTGEWFLDLTAGTPYASQILGKNTQPTYDAAIQAVILDTDGVLNIVLYESSVDSKRNLTVNATINTVYGEVSIAAQIPSTKAF